jgi:hypothetical protein
MKKIVRFIAPIVLSAALLLPSAAFAGEPVEIALPEKIVLHETTPLSNADGSGPTGLALAPQTVTVIGMKGNLMSYTIDTWVGPMYIVAPDTKVEKIYPRDDKEQWVGKVVQLNKVTPLHSGANYFPSGAALAPQSIKITGQNGIYLIVETWLGWMYIDKRDVQ